ncbi:MAG TPA: pilin, partial [Gammaproteobacteria bacterium]|nr:pilin [Gammaproteobacteria bacterium]
MLCTQCGAQAGVTDPYCARCGAALAGNGTAPQDGAATAAAPATESELARAAIGKNAAYYLPRFERLAAGESRSWHWPALVIPLGWFLYRKMWNHAGLYFVAVPMAVAALGAVLGRGVLRVAIGAWVVARLAVLPMYANALYHRVVEKRVAEAKRRIGRARQLEYLEREGGTSNALIIAIVLLAVLVFAMPVGVAITIPAYRDYTVRVQVTEGMMLAERVQSAVAEAIAASGAAPESLEAAGLPPDRIEGKYVDSVDITGGRIDVRYGNDASVQLAGRVLSLTPYEVAQGGGSVVAWRCGLAPEPKS